MKNSKSRSGIKEDQYVEIITYFDKFNDLYFEGTEEDFKQFKEFYGIYPYKNEKD